MIGPLIQDNRYEQDIRELLVSFYPGETYIHKVEDGLDLYVETRLGGSTVSILIWENGVALKGWELLDSRARPSGPSDHSVAKNVMKKMLYPMLVARTDKGMPWGSLTGTHPAKITPTRPEESWKERDTHSFIEETYLASDGKVNLSTGIATRGKKLLEPLDYERGYSLYAGISLCPTTCLYYSFTSYPTEKWRGRTGLYLEVLFKELEYTARKMGGRPPNMVYFDGSTPMSLPVEDLEAPSDKLEQLFDLSRMLEFTVEAGRPDSTTPDKLKVLKDHGITRTSTNPQTMNQRTLDLTRCHHTVKMVRERFYTVRELGFDNIDVGLIMGLPEGNMDDVQRTLEEVRAPGPDSPTVHSLAIERAIRLNTFREKYGRLKIQNALEIVELSAACAREMGMEPYYLYYQKDMAGNFENVGYSLPSKTYIYNILIMGEMQTITARGAGTTTKVVFPSENRRKCCENVKGVEQYVGRIDEMIQRKECIPQLQARGAADSQGGENH